MRSPWVRCWWIRRPSVIALAMPNLCGVVRDPEPQRHELVFSRELERSSKVSRELDAPPTPGTRPCAIGARRPHRSPPRRTVLWWRLTPLNWNDRDCTLESSGRHGCQMVKPIRARFHLPPGGILQLLDIQLETNELGFSRSVVRFEPVRIHLLRLVQLGGRLDFGEESVFGSHSR